MERLLEYFVPEKYILDLMIDEKTKSIGGTVTVTGRAKAKDIKFHAVGLSVDEVLVNGKKVKFEVVDGVLTLIKVPSGDLKVEIGYHGSLNENMQGAYISTYEHKGKTGVIVATQFESHYAREAFPCIDEPEAKAVFELTITARRKYMVLANTPERTSEKPHFGHAQGRSAKLTVLNGVSSEVHEVLRNAPSEASASGYKVSASGYKASASGFKTTSFEPTPRMSTYLLAWVIGKFHGKTVENTHGVKITTYAALNQDIDSVDFANEIAAKSLEFYDDNFGVPYPLEKLDQVALPDFEAGAMENWGLVTYRESMLLVGKNATLGTKKSVALTVAHELSHQWFGDLVTMKWWDDLWLNESFASVMEYYAVDYIHPEYKIFEGFFTGDCYAALVRDAHNDVQSVHQDVASPEEIATLFDGAIVYSKGARLMLMLIRMMGWENFCKGIRDYFEKFKYQNTVGDDLWASLKPYAEFDPGELMHAFIDKPGYPVIIGTKQKRFLLDGPLVEESWPLPEISIDMSGHYVVDFSDEEFGEKLAQFETFGLEEKLRLLMDRNLLSRTELVNSASLLPLVAKFKNEETAAVWNMVLAIVSNLKMFFDIDSAEEKKFKKFVGELVAPKLAEVGLVTREGDDENTIRLRAALLSLDYYAETKENLEKLAEMEMGDYVKLDPETREDILDAKLYIKPDVIDKYLQVYQEIADPELKFELLFAGTLAKDQKVLDKMLGLLEKPEIVKPQDQLHLYIYLYRNLRSREQAYQWLIGHWDYVKKMAGDKSLDSYPRYMANMVRTQKEYDGWRDFFMPMKDDPALARAIKIGEKEIEARLKLIEEDKKAVYEELDLTDW